MGWGLLCGRGIYAKLSWVASKTHRWRPGLFLSGGGVEQGNPTLSPLIFPWTKRSKAIAPCLFFPPEMKEQGGEMVKEGGCWAGMMASACIYGFCSDPNQISLRDADGSAH